MAGEQRSGKARLVGINHVALEVGNIDEALAFWGRLFDVTLRGRSETMAFIDLGDQFIALSSGRTQDRDEDRHFGLVVDDRAPLRARACGDGRPDPAGPRPRLPRPLGQPHPDRRLPRHPVHQGPRGARRHGPRRLDKSPDALDELARKGIRFS